MCKHGYNENHGRVPSSPRDRNGPRRRMTSDSHRHKLWKAWGNNHIRDPKDIPRIVTYQKVYTVWTFHCSFIICKYIPIHIACNRPTLHINKLVIYGRLCVWRFLKNSLLWICSILKNIHSLCYNNFFNVELQISLHTFIDYLLSTTRTHNFVSAKIEIQPGYQI